MRTKAGAPPPKISQTGLKDTLQTLGYFLPCVCIPTGDMDISLPSSDVVSKTHARVLSKSNLNSEIVRLILQCESAFEYRAGQFISLHRYDGLVRSYSIANTPNGSGKLELHIRHLPDGQMSEWIHDELEVGETVEITGPAGNCFYIPRDPECGLLLIGTGTGLAPLIGIIHDALNQGHRGLIRLYHGSWQPAGLYLMDELQELARNNPNFEYTPCVDEDALIFMRTGRADEIALRENTNLAGWNVFLCGHPEMVKNSRKLAFLSGASMNSIYADPFVISKPANTRD